MRHLTELSLSLNFEIFLSSFGGRIWVLAYSRQDSTTEPEPPALECFLDSAHPSDSPKGKGHYALQISWHLRSSQLLSRRSLPVFLVLQEGSCRFPHSDLQSSLCWPEDGEPSA